MTSYAALDVSQETTAICVVDENGQIVAEKIVATCPDTIATWLLKHTNSLARVGLETGPLAVWLWNELREQICRSYALTRATRMRRSDALQQDRPERRGRVGSDRPDRLVQAGADKSRDSYEIRSLLSGREVLVRIRVKIENEIRGLLRTFGVLFGKTAGGFARRAQEIVAGDLDASPTMQLVIETLMQARAAILDRIKILERRVVAAARTNSTARLFMTAPGVGAITALSVISAFDKVSRFEKSSSAGAYLGLTPRRYKLAKSAATGTSPSTATG